MRRLISSAFFVVGVVAGVAGCPKSANVDPGKCVSNTDCPQFTFCDPAGVCRCNSDDACDASEFCNAAGSCQQKQECFTDDDCGGLPSICDTRLAPITAGAPNDGLHSSTSGQCVTLNSTNTQCLLDSHCPFGFFCNSGVCQQGCRDNGDCPLNQPCIDNQCDAAPGACNEPGYCQFGQICNGNDQCQDHADRNILCNECRGDDQLNQGCGGDNPCLIDPAVPSTSCTNDSQCSQGYCVHFPCLQSTDCPNGETCEGAGVFTPGTCTGHCGDFFCGNATCNDQTDPCPRGYSCFQLIVVSSQTCTRGGGQCQAGSQCSADLPGELNETGSCSCLSDNDCPVDPNTFTNITCVNPGPGGACVQGSTCGPSSGLQCSDLR